MKEELKNTFDSVYLQLEFDQTSHCYINRWAGYITVDNIKEGYKTILDKLEGQPCPNLLVDNQKVVGGSWSQALNWLTREWAPQSMRAGLQKAAIVVAPGSFAHISATHLQQRLSSTPLQVQVFEDEAEAFGWLKEPSV